MKNKAGFTYPKSLTTFQPCCSFSFICTIEDTVSARTKIAVLTSKKKLVKKEIPRRLKLFHKIYFSHKLLLTKGIVERIDLPVIENEINKGLWLKLPACSNIPSPLLIKIIVLIKG